MSNVKRVLVTGGAGFIGSNLIRRLAPSYEVWVLDDFSSGLRSNLDGVDLNLIERDVCAPMHDLSRQNLKFETIVHLAARGSVPRSLQNPIKTTLVNMNGTQNILELAREHQAKFIFSSSSSVYGKNPSLPKRETDWISPLSPYAASKAAAEAYVLAYGHSFGVPVSVLRFFNVFGPGQRPDHVYSAVIPKWIWAAMNDRPIQVFGDGNQTRDFTFVEVVVDVLSRLVTEPSGEPELMNLASGNQISLLGVIDLLNQHFPRLKVEFKPARAGDVLHSQNDPQRLRAFFPDLLEVKFEEALSRTIDWFEKFGQTVSDGPQLDD